jgi:hypothetical protein
MGKHVAHCKQLTDRAFTTSEASRQLKVICRQAFERERACSSRCAKREKVIRTDLRWWWDIFMKSAPWRFAVLAIALLFVLTGCGRGPKPLPLVGFKVEFGEQNIPTQMAADKTVPADISVKNASERTWPSKPDQKGRYAVSLSYHWLDQRGQVVVFDGLRTALPRDVKPGESVKLNASIRTPQHPGQYTLEVTLVQESVAWFPEKDGGKLTLPVTVVEDRAMGENVDGATAARASVAARS